MKVDIEKWSENLKDEESHLAKNKAVGKLIKIEAVYHEICKTVAKNFQTRDWTMMVWVIVSLVAITHVKRKPASFTTCRFLATTNKEVPCSAMLPSHEILFMRLNTD